MDIAEVAKAVARAMKARTAAAPVAKSENPEMIALMAKQIDVMKSQNDKINGLEKALENVLKSVGIADEVTKTYQAEFEQSRVDAVNKTNGQDWEEVKKSIDEFKNIFSGKSSAPVQSNTGWGMDTMTGNPHAVRKSIEDSLKANLPVLQTDKYAVEHPVENRKV